VTGSWLPIRRKVSSIERQGCSRWNSRATTIATRLGIARPLAGADLLIRLSQSKPVRDIYTSRSAHARAGGLFELTRRDSLGHQVAISTAANNVLPLP